MALAFLNTLGRVKQPFSPLFPPKVGVYSCGPTVYQYAHIGNLRAYIFADLLNRVLRAEGYEVKHLINITDVGHLVGDEDFGEDKVEKSAKAENKTASEIARFYTEAFMADLAVLNIDQANYIFPKATDYIKEQIELVAELEKKGFLYRLDDGLYFDTSLFPRYAELGQLDLVGQQSGTRVELVSGKRQSSDFAVWKFSPANEKREQEWDSPWGKGFPGWHLECTAMIFKHLGQQIDIHTGGIDHIPVHHTNEIAQAESISEKKYANFWLHANFLTVDGEKMAKSLGNIYRLEDLVAKGFSPLAFRYFCLGAHYRSGLNFTWEALGSAQVALDKIKNITRELAFRLKTETIVGRVDEIYWQKFKGGLEDDLNSPQALAVLWQMLDDKEIVVGDKLATLLRFDEILGLGLGVIVETVQAPIPIEIQELFDKREQARAQKDFARADELRTEIEKAGWQVVDFLSGSGIWSKD